MYKTLGVAMLVLVLAASVMVVAGCPQEEPAPPAAPDVVPPPMDLGDEVAPPPDAEVEDADADAEVDGEEPAEEGEDAVAPEGDMVPPPPIE